MIFYSPIHDTGKSTEVSFPVGLILVKRNFVCKEEYRESLLFLE